MTDWTKITKEQFDIASDNHMPSKMIIFAFKHFSTTTEKKDMSLKNDIVFILSGLFLLGYLGTIFNVAKFLIAMATIPYIIVLSTLALYLFSAAILNNIRIHKIIKELSVNRVEYDALLAKFY